MCVRRSAAVNGVYLSSVFSFFFVSAELGKGSVRSFVVCRFIWVRFGVLLF